MLTREETAILRRILERHAAEPAAPAAELPAELHVGDLAQIRPFASPTFGGMVLYVAELRPHQVLGWLMRPHRGGCRAAWLTWNYCDLERIGPSFWPQPAFARRRWCAGADPACHAGKDPSDE